MSASELDGVSRGAKVVLVSAASIRPQPVRWAVRNRIPLRAVTLLVGDPGLGKSTLTIEYAARASQGQLDGDLYGEPATVALITAEDALAEVVRPRLEAAGADLERVKLVVVERDGLTGGLALPDDTEPLREQLRVDGVRLLFIDPLVAYLPGDVNTHRDQDVRRALAPLAALAEELELAVVAVVHLNKSTMASVLGRVAGSIGFVAAARSVLLLGADPDDPEGPTRILAHAKTNLGLVAPALRLRVEGRVIHDDGGQPIATSGIAWVGEAAGIFASDLVGGAPTEAPDAISEAKAFLTELLAEGRVEAGTAEAALRKANIPERAWKKAKRQLEIQSKREGFGAKGTWYWQLPSGKEVRSPDPSLFGENGRAGAEKAAPLLKEGRSAEGGQRAVTEAEASAFDELIGVARDLFAAPREPGEEG